MQIIQKSNIYIFVYILLFCFVTDQNSKNEKLIMKYEKKEWEFTVDKEDEVGNIVYELIKASNNSIDIPMHIDSNFNSLYIAFSEIGRTLSGPYSPNANSTKLGDFIYLQNNGDYIFHILGQDLSNTSVVKCGEIERSSLEDFHNFANTLSQMKQNSTEPTITFLIREYENSEPSTSSSQEKTKVIVLIASAVVASVIIFACVFALIK